MNKEYNKVKISAKVQDRNNRKNHAAGHPVRPGMMHQNTYLREENMLNISKTINDDRMNIVLEGRLDTVTSQNLEEELKDSLDGVKELILDFGGLNYISSAGLRVLLATQKIMMKQGEMKLVRVNDEIMEIMDITGFSEILTIE